jgi:hypothetical protein
MHIKSLIVGLALGIILGGGAMWLFGDDIRGNVGDATREVGRTVKDAGRALEKTGRELD